MPSSDNHKSSPWRVVSLIVIAIAIVAAISFLPLEKWSNGNISDFNLLSDIVKSADSDVSTDINAVETDIDSQAAEYQQELVSSQVSQSDSASVSECAAVKPNKENGLVIIEDYTTSGNGLEHLRNSIRSGKLSRIAVLGDSYIEGDILTQDLREQLQDVYGGAGVGYVNMHSEFPGFRRSLRQGGNGWKEYSVSGKANTSYLGISGHYHKPTGKAVSTYKGVTALGHLKSWNKSQFLFISPENTTVTTKVNGGEAIQHSVTGSPEVQAIIISGPTESFEVSTSGGSLIGLGVWLNDTTGVSVDCMSSRGYSGTRLSELDGNLVSGMSRYIDYDLIILEFGVNVMSAKQTNYESFTKRMVKAVDRLRECYPNADILMMGIGDRGEKRGSEVHSMKAAVHMVDAQRKAAREARCLFWDTREAMGGDDAIVEWTRKGYTNKDYIHLSHKGGKALSTPLFNAIKHNLDK